MSLYSHKQAGTGVAQPWSQTITLAEAGKGCDGLFSLYDSQGDKTLVGANTIATLLDGPEKVVRYGALTLGDGVTATSLTASNRCKGLTILCDSLVVKANATLHMNARSPFIAVTNYPQFSFVDFRIPRVISLTSSVFSLREALSRIKSDGYAPWDRGLWDSFGALIGLQCSVVVDGTAKLVDSTSLATYGAGGFNLSLSWTPGSTGGVAPLSPGGGGGGATYGAGNLNSSGGRGGRATPYGGGAGGSAVHAYSNGEGYINGGHAMYSHPALGATYSPAETLSGGWRLTVICRGVITVNSGGTIEANGSSGGTHGGFGGGIVSLMSPTAASNAGTIRASGGAALGAGGAGGAGSVVTKTFSDMGW